jgi:hypothetical protein
MNKIKSPARSAGLYLCDIERAVRLRDGDLDMDRYHPTLDFHLELLALPVIFGRLGKYHIVILASAATPTSNHGWIFGHFPRSLFLAQNLPKSLQKC